VTDYPGALHAFIDASGKADTALSSEHVAAHVELADELAAVQAELGIAPSGTFATVKARLAALPMPGAYGALKAGSSVAYHYPYWDGVSGALPGTLGTPSGWDLTAIYQAARVQ